jgi:peptidoglycan/LPS O-acetylase OafA/YrhL
MDSIATPGRRPQQETPPFRANSTGFLRLAAALAVIVSHSYGLGGWGVDPIAAHSTYATLGSLAVGVFFTLSGLLVANSIATSPSIWRYAWHRIVRIVPGYWTACVVLAFAFGPAIAWAEYGTWRGYLALQPGAFVRANLFGVQAFDIAPLLASVPHPYDLVGPWWSIPWECKCYLALGVGGAFGLLRRWPMVVCAGLMYGAMVARHVLSPADPLCGTYDALTCFAFGTCLYVLRERIVLDARLAALAGLAILPALTAPGGYGLLPVALCYLVYWLAYRLPTWTRRVNARADLSYGTYLYGMPVGQLLAVLAMHRSGFLPYTLLTMACTLGVAALSWRYVEAPALRLKTLAWPQAKIQRAGATGGALTV